MWVLFWVRVSTYCESNVLLWSYALSLHCGSCVPISGYETSCHPTITQSCLLCFSDFFPNHHGLPPASQGFNPGLSQLVIAKNYPSVSLDHAKTCSFCGKVYTNEQIYEEHVAKCRKKKVICNVCGLRCLYPRDLRKHMKIHENKEKNYAKWRKSWIVLFVVKESIEIKSWKIQNMKSLNTLNRNSENLTIFRWSSKWTTISMCWTSKMFAKYPYWFALHFIWYTMYSTVKL